MVIIACHAREQPQLSCRYHRRRSQCELSKKLSWTRQLGKNPKRKEKKESSQPTTSKGKAHRTNPVLPFLRGGWLTRHHSLPNEILSLTWAFHWPPIDRDQFRCPLLILQLSSRGKYVLAFKTATYVPENMTWLTFKVCYLDWWTNWTILLYIYISKRRISARPTRSLRIPWLMRSCAFRNLNWTNPIDLPLLFALFTPFFYPELENLFLPGLRERETRQRMTLNNQTKIRFHILFI